jgi:hypothetical protein
MRFRFAASLLVGNCLLSTVSVVLLIHSLMTDERHMTMVAAVLGIVSLILVLAQWTAASRAGCPLCMTPVLAPRACMKHRRARTVLGSHRLRVALAILFKNQFRCPYCNESTSLELKDRLRRSSSADLHSCMVRNDKARYLER